MRSDINTTFPYNIDEITDFLQVVFNDEPLENVCGFLTVKGAPGFPKPMPAVLKRLGREPTPPLACYFSTASMNIDQRSGELRNRQGNMRGLYVVVLDDIGTKIPEPTGLEPTYKIETSPGNQQWGFVLDQPITDLAEAQLMIKLVYTSGLTDAGGAMPNKLVRLPCGINGKPGDKKDFKVRLLEMSRLVYTPQELLDTLGVPGNWEALCKDPEIQRKKLMATMGTTSYRHNDYKGATTDGVADPLLEWLYSRNDVTEGAGDWVTITCPWADKHTDGKTTAGYSPLGYGGSDYHRKRRGFKCFHDHCNTKHIGDFLLKMEEWGAPQVPSYDPFYRIIAKYIYVNGEDRYVHASGNTDAQLNYGIGKAQFPVKFPGTLQLNPLGGSMVRENAHTHFINHPHALIVDSIVLDPGGPRLQINKDEESKLLNLFWMPEYVVRTPDMEQVQPFLNFIDYLIPTPEEREYFLDWLACKAQDLKFKGAGIVMVAESEGVGRGTLARIIGLLFGHHNVWNESFSNIVNAQFNPFMKSLFLTCDETLTDRSPRAKEKVYEILKGMVDPGVTNITINEKGRKQYALHGGPLVMLFSNHADALYLRRESRRFYIITNGEPAPHSMFVSLNAWMDSKNDAGKPAWADSVWSWLLERNVNPAKMREPAPETQGKRVMIDASRTRTETIFDAVLEAWPLTFITVVHAKRVARNVAAAVGMQDAAAAMDHHARDNHRVRVASKLYSEAPKTLRVGDKVLNVRAKVNERIPGVEVHKQLEALRKLVANPAELLKIEERAIDLLDY